MEAFCKKCVVVFTVYLLIIKIDSKQIKNFYAVETKASYIRAHSICRDNHMQLATVESEREQEFLEMHLRQAQIQSDTSETFLINARRKNPYRSSFDSEDIFEWQTNPERVVNYTKWHEDEPNNKGSIENCVAISKRDGRYGWNDVPCGIGYNYHFICMKFTDDNAEENVENTTPEDYDYYKDSDEGIYPRRRFGFE